MGYREDAERETGDLATDLSRLIDLAKRALRDNPRQSERYAQDALELAQRTGDPAGEASARFIMGRMCLVRGESQRALFWLLGALRHFESDDRRMSADVLRHVGIAHSIWGNLDEATAFFERAIEIAAEFEDERLATGARNGLALALLQADKLAEARVHLEAVIETARLHHLRDQLGTALNNLGVVHSREKRFRQARACWDESLAIRREAGDERGIAIGLMNLAEFHLETGDVEAAEAPLRQGLEGLERLGLTDPMRDGLELLSRFEQARGDLPAAIAALRRLAEAQNEQFDEVRTRSMAEMQARFDMQAAEREVARSQKRSRELSDALRQADRLGAIGRLAGGIAHDFNNVLTAMTGYADLILMTVDEKDRVRRHVREIRRGGERAGQLTQQLLAFSRKQVLQPQVLDLTETIRDLLGMLRRLLGEDIDTRLALARDLDLVYVDAGQVEQVIVNLAINARDAMPEGGQLVIATHNVPARDAPADVREEVEGDALVRLDVVDRGSGIPPDVLQHIFEPFFTTKNESDGTGLGLATVYGIVKQSGGTIRVESTVGEGTSFRVYFPRTHRPLPLAEQPQQDGALPGGPETILVVEDNGAVRELTRQILRVCGYRVLAVSDPESGLEVAREHPGMIHLLLTDVVLPGMRGTELAARMCAQRPETRVLYMSGYPFEALNDKGTLSPDIELVQKPFTPSQLSRHVRAVLDRVASS